MNYECLLSSMPSFKAHKMGTLKLWPGLALAFQLAIAQSEEWALDPANLNSERAGPMWQPSVEFRATPQKRLSLHVKPDEEPFGPMPDWCTPASERRAGPWHMLSDDEYTNESPYLLCGVSDSGSRMYYQRPSQRRAAHARGACSFPHRCQYKLLIQFNGKLRTRLRQLNERLGSLALQDKA